MMAMQVILHHYIYYFSDLSCSEVSISCASTVILTESPCQSMEDFSSIKMQVCETITVHLGPDDKEEAKSEHYYDPASGSGCLAWLLKTFHNNSTINSNSGKQTPESSGGLLLLDSNSLVMSAVKQYPKPFIR